MPDAERRVRCFDNVRNIVVRYFSNMKKGVCDNDNDQFIHG